MTMYRLNSVPANVRALPILQSASGSIATFDTDMTENLVEVKCQIVAQQGGSGTPSPDNERPITTYSEMNVVATGKNLTTIFTDGKVPSISTGKLVNAGGGRSVFVPVLPNTDYTFSISSSSQNLYIFYYDSNHGFLSYDGLNVQALTSTTPNNCAYIMLRTAFNASQVTNAQLEKGSTATTYEPFGTTANIPFGQTVANGVLDVTTGKLRVTHKGVDLGSLTWNKAGTTPNIYFYADILDIKQTTSTSELLYGVCSHYDRKLQSSWYANKPCIFALQNASRIAIADDTYNEYTSAQFEVAMSGVVLAYELATPQEIQLSSTQITALLNENNIWCDTGDTSVKYWMSINKYIGQ